MYRQLPTRAGIHKACLRKKNDLKTNSFQTLFINAILVVYLTFYGTDLSTVIFFTQDGVFFPKYSIIMHRKLSLVINVLDKFPLNRMSILSHILKSVILS